MRLLVTGATGFVGHHFVEHVQATTDWDMVGLYSFRHRGDPARAVNFDHDRIDLVRCDLTFLTTRQIAALPPIDAIVNFAAESHVDRSIVSPREFVENNVSAMMSILEASRRLKPKVFIQISTDEVYGPAKQGESHAPWAPIRPSNPYSASKAAQEALAYSWWRTYGVPVVMTNTMNMIGERQDGEKFLPLIIRHVLEGTELTIHGTPERIGTRHYLHARNLADALVSILRHPAPHPFPLFDDPPRYHIVGDELSNLDLAKMVAEILGRPLRFRFEDFHRTRPGHDPRYSLASSPPAWWEPPVSFEESLRRTVEWTVQHPEWLR